MARLFVVAFHVKFQVFSQRKNETKIKRFSFRWHNNTMVEITEKVSMNISIYSYILSGQKFIKNAQKGPIWRVFEILKCYQTGQF